MAIEKPQGYLTADEAAKKFNVTKKTIITWCRIHRLKAEKINNRFFIPGNAEPKMVAAGRPKTALTEYSKQEERLPPHSELPKCPARTCFNNWDGRCTGLTECLYNKTTHHCPFYKFVGDYHAN